MGDTDPADDGPAPERRFLGVVEVDSGTLLLGDPVYCLPDNAQQRAGIDYAAVLSAPDEPGSYLGGAPVLLLGRFGGDGTFPVFAEFDEEGMVARVTVEFVDPPEATDASRGSRRGHERRGGVRLRRDSRSIPDRGRERDRRTAPLTSSSPAGRGM